MFKTFTHFGSLILIFGILFVSCSKEQSVDPDISAVDSTAEFSFTSVEDSIVEGTQVGLFVNNSSADSSYIGLPISVTKTGTYDVSATVYLNGDSLILKGSGSLVSNDSIIKLYPTNLYGFSAGSYISDSITGNHILLNGVLSGYLLNVSVTVTDSSAVSTSMSSIGETTHRHLFFNEIGILKKYPCRIASIANNPVFFKSIV